MDKQHESAIMIVRDYEEYLQFIYEWRGYDFKQLSYSKWAVKEIVKCLEDMKTPPLTVIENFRDKMLSYAGLNKRNDLIFSTAASAAEDIIDLFM